MARRSDPDSKLLIKAKSGNSIAFGKLVEKYQDHVLNIVYDYVGNYDIAKDIAQDVFLKVFVKISSFEGKSRFSTWLYRVAVNTCLDVKRQEKRSPFRFFSDSKDVEQIKDNLIEENSEFTQLEQHIYKLTNQQKTAVILRFFHGKPVNDIAEIMECNSNTVRTHIYRGVEKIKKSIKTK